MNPTGLPVATQSGAGAPSAAIPHLDIDPFSIAFFDDPYPAHEQMREAGPVVYLDTWNVFGVARYAEVYAVLNDPKTFCSSRGVGLSDFAKEKPWRPPSLILEADPPAHTRTRAVLSKVLSPAVMKRLRDALHGRSGRQDRRVVGARTFRCGRRSRGSLSAVGVSGCGGTEAGRARASAPLCQPGLQCVRSAQRAAAAGDRALGAASGLCHRAVSARQSHARWFRRLRPRFRR